jgi:hypothetical protein
MATVKHLGTARQIQLFLFRLLEGGRTPPKACEICTSKFLLFPLG